MRFPSEPQVIAIVIEASALLFWPSSHICAAPFQELVQGVVLETGGDPPQDPALIQTVCNGVTRVEGQTDKKGRFSIELGERTGPLTEIGLADGERAFALPRGGRRLGRSGPGVNSAWALDNCELRAHLPGYSSEPVRLGHRSLANPNIGTIYLKRLGVVEGRLISATALAAPKAAVNSYQSGMDELRHNRRDAARERFAEAVEIYPRYAAAWCELGRLQAARGQAEAARASFEAALRADSRFLPPYVFMAELHARANQWERLDETTSNLIRLDPFDYPEAYLMHAVARYNLGDPNAAEQNLLRAQEIDQKQRLPQTWYLLGLILAERGDHAGAAGQFREYLRIAPGGPSAAAARQQLKNCEARTTAAIPQNIQRTQASH